MFRGLTKLSVDSKGRIAVPKAHRDKLLNEGIDSLCVTADPIGCLLVYPEPVWLELEEQIARLPNADPEVREQQELYIGYAELQAFDSTGRIMLNQPQREFGGIERRVYLIGVGKKFELWSEAAWEAKLHRIKSRAQQGEQTAVPSAMQELNF